MIYKSIRGCWRFLIKKVVLFDINAYLLHMMVLERLQAEMLIKTMVHWRSILIFGSIVLIITTIGIIIIIKYVCSWLNVGDLFLRDHNVIIPRSHRGWR